LSYTQVEDLPQQVEGDLVDTTWPRLQELLEKHPEARVGDPGRSRTLALFGVLCRLCWPQFVAAGICRLFYIVTGYAQPLGLYIILRRFGKDDAFGWTAVGLLFGGPLPVWKSATASGASAMMRPSWLGRAARNRHRHAIEQASRRRRERAVKL
jgi:hypothetical protein